jgi:hypothetical protein
MSSVETGRPANSYGRQQDKGVRSKCQRRGKAERGDAGGGRSNLISSGKFLLFLIVIAIEMKTSCPKSEITHARRKIHCFSPFRESLHLPHQVLALVSLGSVPSERGGRGGGGGGRYLALAVLVFVDHLEAEMVVRALR